MRVGPSEFRFANPCDPRQTRAEPLISPEARLRSQTFRVAHVALLGEEVARGAELLSADRRDLSSPNTDRSVRGQVYAASGILFCSLRSPNDESARLGA